jgi:CDP-diacylglycerol--glycerol-3-phosphate 3-phosphatidyltransferase
VTTPDDRAARVLTSVTYLRVVLTPIVMALVLYSDRRSWFIPAAAILFTLAAITDFLDGRLARRWKQATALGTFLDTTADKLLVSGVLIALVTTGRANAWLAYVIIGRELMILGLRGAVTAVDGTVVRPSIWGKVKANIQFVAVLLAIWQPGIASASLRLDQLAMLVAAAVTVGSAAEYLARFAGSLARRERRA